MTTLRVFVLLFGGGMLVAYLLMLMTEPVFHIVERPFGRMGGASVAGWFGNLVLALLIVAPGQIIAGASTALAFSLRRHVPVWLVAVLVGGCGALATWRDLSLDGYLVTGSLGSREMWKIVYWTSIVAPALMLPAVLVAWVRAGCGRQL